MLKLPGLPPGVAATKITAVCSPDDYELVGHGDNYQIIKGGRAGAASHLLVEPEDGFAFVFDITRNCYVAAKNLLAKRKFVGTFEASTEQDVADISKIGKHPLCTGMSVDELR